MAKKKNDDRRELLIRFRMNEKNQVKFIDPCCDEMPALLFAKVMKAISEVEEEWNQNQQCCKIDEVLLKDG